MLGQLGVEWPGCAGERERRVWRGILWTENILWQRAGRSFTPLETVAVSLNQVVKLP